MTTDLPLPDTDLPDFAEFWAGCRGGRLLIPSCRRGHLTWPPRPACRICQAPIAEWAEVSGSGRLYSWTVVHRTRLRGFSALTPYVVGIVALDDDPAVRLLGRCTCAPNDVFAGAAMSAIFDVISDRVTLLLWRLNSLDNDDQPSAASARPDLGTDPPSLTFGAVTGYPNHRDVPK
jgi:uncharacterized OB-fold protein